MNRYTRAALALALAADLSACSGSRIRSAAERGDVETVKRLLAKDPRLTEASDFGPGYSAIQLAASAGHANVVEVLLAAGAQPRDAMKQAAEHGHTDVVALLWEKGGPATREPAIVQEALVRAADTGHIPPLEWLLAHGGDINARSPSGWTALQCAAFRANPSLIKWLHDHGARLDDRGKYGWTPLFCAAASGDAGVTELLIQLGAEVNVTSPSGGTPLTRAAKTCELPVMRVLLQHQVDVNLRNGDNNTALILVIRGMPPYENSFANHRAFVESGKNKAQEQTCLPIVQLLLEHHADVTVRNKDGLTAFDIATARGWQEVAAAVCPKDAVVASTATR